MKKVLSLALAILIGSGCFAMIGCKGGSKGASNEFTYWTAVTESSVFYTKYEDNPVMQYLMNYKTFTDQNGEQSNIHFTFQSPVAGKEVDAFNTMMSTRSYTDIFDLSYGGNLEEFYNEGLILDLTEYVRDYMPNYMAYFESHPELLRYATYTIDGERKFLSLIGVNDAVDVYSQFCGYCYRRDWIVKYGAPPALLWELDEDNRKVYRDNPDAGGAFSGYYSLGMDGNEIHALQPGPDVNSDSWVDNVVFPSGNADPIYISDWEWMMEIFARAMADQGIDDGYVMSLYYPGYIANGELVNAFGGGGPCWYVDKDTGEAAFGAVGEGFKTYLACMNGWYDKGWIDRRFQEKSSEAFYKIDETLIYQGKVALWMGQAANLGARISNANYPLTDGAMVFGAACPINDVYGSDAVKYVKPYVMFQAEMTGGGIAVTDKAKDKDLVLLCRFFDYLYTEEGAVLKNLGLSKEQADECQSRVYAQQGLMEGAYTPVGDGTYRLAPLMEEDQGNLRSAMTLRLPGMFINTKISYSYPETYIHSRQQWVLYESTGFFGGQRNLLLTADENIRIEKIRSAIELEYMYVVVPQFIIGTKSLERDYETFLSDLKKRGYEEYIDIRNESLKR